MPASAERTIHAVLIPWVIALVALLGLNAIIADYSWSRKGDFPGETGISQPADVAVVVGQAASQQVFLIPCSSIHAAIQVFETLCIEVFREEPAIGSLSGAVRGRAPPAGMLA